MPNLLETEESLRQIDKPLIDPWWKVVLLLALLITSSLSIFFLSAWLGAILFFAAIVFHTYSEFGAAQQFAGETRFRIVGFVVTWMIVILFSVLSQFAYPQFNDLFSSFGSSLPIVTELVMAAYPGFLLLPIIIGYVWFFWPNKSARLRVATRFGWLSIAFMILAFGSLYLPILKMGMAV